MLIMRYFALFVCLVLPIISSAKSDFKFENSWVNRGEILHYKATWGFLTIGTASTKIHADLYKVGTKVCYKVEINGQTNGLAKIFSVHDSWTSYIDTSTITTHKSYRRIREGKYELDEKVVFDHLNKKATVEVYNKNSKNYQLKNIYDTPENIRDIIAGFLVFQLVDLSTYNPGEVFSVNGFYDDEGYNIDVRYIRTEIVKTDNGKVMCYKVVPSIPKNKVFKGTNAIEIWLSKKSHNIVRISAKMFVGHVIIDLKKD